MTTITLDGAAVGSGLGALVPPLDLRISPGVVSVLAVESDERPMLVSMLIGGRFRADAGRILIDGRDDVDALRSAVALVDTPFVVAPPDETSLALVVAEEFSFCGVPSSRRHVVDFLARHGLEDYTRLPVRALPPGERIRLFSELAILREGVTAIVLTSPERHGGGPSSWYPSLVEIASRGFAVAVITDAPTAGLLLDLGARDAGEQAGASADAGAGAEAAPVVPARSSALSPSPDSPDSDSAVPAES